jgi:hypothetical protein
MNVFQLNYDARLKSWYELRKNIEHLDTQTKCIEIDNWWQKAPLVNYHLHPADMLNWPQPWELLAENTYCIMARGLGICYTLLLLGITSIDFFLGKDDNTEDVTIVLVDNAKYILNYYPNTVLSNNLQDFKINSQIDITELTKKIK